MAENGYTSQVILGPDGQPFRRPDVNERPPLRDMQGQPLYGEDGFLLPHQRTFSAVYNAISRTYRWYFDEALKHNQQNALAMRRDVAILEMLRERQLPVAQLKWHIEPEEPKDEYQQTLAEDLEKILLKTPRFQQLRMSLLEAEWYGRYGVQLAWRWYDDHGRRVMRIADWRPVNGDKIQYDYDGTPGIHIQASEASEYPQEYVRYGDRTPLLMLVPPHWRSKFIIHRHEIDDADYFEPELAGGVHGVGIRHRIYWLWWMRNEVLTWALDFLERIGAGGLTVFYYDASSPEAKTAAEKAAMEYDRNVALAWPRYSGGKETGSMIERIEPGSGNGEFVLSIVKYFDDAMRRYVVGQNLSSQAESTGLGSKLSELHGDTKFRILKWDAENLDETLTTDLVKVAQYWNYGGQADFEMRFMSSMDKPNPEKQLEAVQTATSIGVRFREDEVRELTGLSKPEDDDEVVGGEATLGMDEDNPFGEEEDKGKEAGQDQSTEGANRSQDQGRPFHRRGQPLRYDKGRWITIGARSGEGGKKHGGSPVFIENGRITKGHPGLTGKKIGALKEPAEESSHRKQLQQSRGHARATWEKKARKAGVPKEDLNQLASEMLAHDKEFKSDRTALLQHARKSLAGFGVNVDNLRQRAAHGNVDYTSIPHLDQVAQELAGIYPHEFRGEHETYSDQRLFDLLMEGNPVPMAESEAYEQAFEHLEQEYSQVKTDEPVPFQREPLAYDRLMNIEKNMELLAELIDRSIEPTTDEERDRRMDRRVWPDR